MGDDDESAGARPHVLGQPGDALDVQVVGGLVEHEQVQRPDQLGGQRHAAALATGHRGDRGVEAQPVELEAGEHRADGGVAGPLVLGGEHRRREDDVAHRRPGREGAGLVEDAHRHVAAEGDPAGVGLVGAGEQRQQRALAAAVAADDTDPLAGGDPEGDVVEDDGRAVCLVHPLEVDQVQGCAHRPQYPRRLERTERTQVRGAGQARRVTSTVTVWPSLFGPGEQSLERRDVAVVAAAPEGDVPGADVHGVGRVEGVPAAVPPLHPGVALPGDRLARSRRRAWGAGSRRRSGRAARAPGAGRR